MRELIDIMNGKKAKAKAKPIMESGEGAAILREAMIATMVKDGLIKEGRVDKEAAKDLLMKAILVFGSIKGMEMAANSFGFDVGGGGGGDLGSVGGAYSPHAFDGTYSGTDRMGIEIPYREDGQQGIADGTSGDSYGNYAHNGIDVYDRN